MTRENLDYIKRKINLKLFNYQHIVEFLLKVFTALFCIAAGIAIIYEHGFYVLPETKNLISSIVTAAFIFYILKYLIRFLYSQRKLDFLKENIMEFIVIIILIISYFVNLQLASQATNIEVFTKHSTRYFHIYYFCIIFIEIAKINTIFKRITMSPPLLMMASFFILISIGTVLLMMPKMTTHNISIVDALFTATSASSITGLTTISVSQNFTQSGQIVIILLMQMGGMSILSFATFFITFLSHSHTGLRYQYLIKDMLETNKISETSFILREIVLSTFIIEGIGIILLFLYWQTTGLFGSDKETLLFAVFHAISAFNNAGFSLWDANMMAPEIYNSYFPQTIIMLLVFIGAIGFVVLRDFFDPAIIKERKRKSWKKLTTGTQIALLTTFSIIIIGTIVFCALEYNKSLAAKDTLFEKLFTSCFQVVSRTSGFNVVDVPSVSTPALLFVMLIMFIGASPGSTGGGIKTTTFFVIIKSIFATIKGKNKIEFNRKTIPFQIVDKSFSIVVISLVMIFVSSFAISIIEPGFSFSDILFESVSSFTTCGLSTGCSAEFSSLGKIVLIFNMYIGRIGTLTFAYALSKRVKETKHEYPETYFMVG